MEKRTVYEALTSHLLDRSKRLAVEAIHSHTHRKSAENTYTYAGSALEAAIKYRLCLVTPFLLAPDNKGWFSQGFKFYRPGESLPFDAITVGFSEAFERLCKIDVSLRSIESHVQTIQKLRNQSVHFGMPSGHTGHVEYTNMAQFAIAMEAVVPVTDRSDFWGSGARFVSDLIDDRGKSVRVSVQRRVLQAQESLRELDEGRLQLLIQGSQNIVEDESYDPDVVAVKCPGCNSIGLGKGSTDDFGDAEADWDGFGYSYIWIPDIRTVIDSFECYVCGLELNSPEEIEAVGMATSIPNERVTSSDLADYGRYGEYPEDL